MRAASASPSSRLPAGSAAMLLALLAIVLQVIAWTTLGLRPGQRRLRQRLRRLDRLLHGLHAALVYWIETQVATVWRRRRDGVETDPGPGPGRDSTTTSAGIKACSFFWTFYVANGVLLFVLLYLL